MDIALSVDPALSEPPFEQLRGQLVEQIMSRELPAGTTLPPVRRLAADLGLAAGTVARAYRELEAEGYVITQGRKGTSVAPIAGVDEAAQRRAVELAAAYVAEMRGLGFGDDAIAGEVRRAL